MTQQLLLIIAYHFPPENEVGGVRPFRFYKYLSRFGLDCHVITAAAQTGQSDENVEWVPDPFLVEVARGPGWQFERLLRKVLLPGALGFRWSSSACRAAKTVLRAHQGAQATILSTYPPLGSHLAAWRLARAERLHWVADFRDPLADNPADVGLNGLQRETLRWLERTFIRSADLIIANTDAVLEGWQARYSYRCGDMHLIWNGFDPEDHLQARPLSARGHKILSHTGELYGGRTAAPLLESLARLIDAGRLSPDKIRIRLVGPAHRSSLPAPEFVEQARHQGWLDLVTEKVSQQQAREIAETSDGLLLLQPQSAVQVPGKLFEYVQIGRPVLALIPRNSPVERILQWSGIRFRCIYTDDSPAATDDAILGFVQLDSSGDKVSPWFEEHFNAEKQAQTLSRLIRSLRT